MTTKGKLIMSKQIFQLLNEAIDNEELNGSVITAQPERNKRPSGATKWTFADWFGADLTGKIYKGSITISEKDTITSLEGAPEEVIGGFYVFDQPLGTLKHLPKKISDDLNISHNELTSLEGCPEEIGGYFDCSGNKIKSLKGGPKKIGAGETYDCKNNPLLRSLEGLPEGIKADKVLADPFKLADKFGKRNIPVNTLKKMFKELEHVQSVLKSYGYIDLYNKLLDVTGYIELGVNNDEDGEEEGYSRVDHVVISK